MDEDVHIDGRRLDRRGFLAAAAGAAATGAAAATLGPWANKSSGAAAKSSDVCVEHPGELPKLRRGSIMYTMPAAAWNTEAAFLDHIAFMKGLNCNAWEFAGAYPVVNGINLGTNPAGWATFGSYAKQYGFRLVGTHDGPNASSAANLGSAVTKMNGWNCNQLGAGSGWPSVPGAGTAITTPASISAWQASCATMNSWGRAFQTGEGSGVLGVTLRQGQLHGRRHRRRPSVRALLPAFPLRAGQVDHRHGHEVRQQLHLRGRLHRARPARTRTRSPTSAGCWTACGCPAAVRASACRAPGDPNPGQGNNRLMAPGRDRALAGPRVHVPRQGPRSDRSGHAGRQRRRQQRPRRGDRPVRRGPVLVRPGHDAVPADLRAAPAPGAPRVPVRARRLQRHGDVERVLQEALRAGLRHDGQDLARPHRVTRRPFDIPTTDADWAAIQVTAIGQRPPEGGGAPGPPCAPKLEGGNEAGDTVEVTDVGVWSRFSEKPRNYNYVWLRDGAPLPKYNAAADRRAGRSLHGRGRADVHAHRRRHRPRDQLLGHGAEPEVQPGQRLDAVHRRDHGRGEAAARHAALGPGSSTLSAGLPEAYQATSSAKGTVDKLDVYVDEGSTANWLIAGIYSNYHNHPDLLLATGEVRISHKRAGGWESVDIGSV